MNFAIYSSGACILITSTINSTGSISAGPKVPFPLPSSKRPESRNDFSERVPGGKPGSLPGRLLLTMTNRSSATKPNIVVHLHDFDMCEPLAIRADFILTLDDQNASISQHTVSLLACLPIQVRAQHRGISCLTRCCCHYCGNALQIEAVTCGRCHRANAYREDQGQRNLLRHPHTADHGSQYRPECPLREGHIHRHGTRRQNTPLPKVTSATVLPGATYRPRIRGKRRSFPSAYALNTRSFVEMPFCTLALTRFLAGALSHFPAGVASVT